MAKAVPVASGTGTAQVLTGGGSLLGVAILPGGAAATVTINDGTSGSDPVIAYQGAAANTASYLPVPAVSFNTGLFITRSATCSLVLYIGG